MEGDPVPAVYWLKNGAHVIPRAQLSADNRTLVINDVRVPVGGVYTCVAENRAGNSSSNAVVAVLSESGSITAEINYCLNLLLLCVQAKFSIF